MNTPSNAVPESFADSKVVASPVLLDTRPFYWSVRRELWNTVRSISLPSPSQA